MTSMQAKLEQAKGKGEQEYPWYRSSLQPTGDEVDQNDLTIEQHPIKSRPQKGFRSRVVYLESHFSADWPSRPLRNRLPFLGCCWMWTDHI